MSLKTACISDTHLLHRKVQVPECELLIHAGDLGFDYAINEDVFIWLSEQPAEFKAFIQGNHDKRGEKEEDRIKEYAEKYNLIYLHHNLVDIKGYKVYGSNYAPTFGRWAWMLDRGYPMYYEWEKIPEETEILVTHSPAWGILDMTAYGDNAGCEELRDRIKDLPKLKLHIAGHIHEARASETIGKVQFVNAAICNESYNPINKPIVIEI